MEKPKSIVHKGEAYFWKCPWGYGDYYENDSGFVLTDKNGKVDLCSSLPVSTREE